MHWFACLLINIFNICYECVNITDSIF